MERLRTRWIIFGSLFAVVVISYLININLESRPSPEIEKSFAFIDSLPDSAVIMISFDHEASSLPEIQPLALVLLRHAFSKNLKVIGLSLFAEGTAIGYRMMTRTAEEFHRTYGRDYVFLGFKPQHISAILGMGESIKRVFPQDYLGGSIDSIPLMKSIADYRNIALVISVADGDRAVQWIEYAGARYKQKIMAAITAAMITTYDPYLASGQLYSAVGGLKGAAEYENLYGRRGGGNRGMVSQMTAHLFVIAMIILGNVAYFRTRKRREK